MFITKKRTEEIFASGFDGKRNTSTAIYFLLDEKSKSHFHRIKSDELWFFHEGTTLEIFCLVKNGLNIISLGKNTAEGEMLQAIIPADTWFKGKVKDEKNYALISCKLKPGFEFKILNWLQKRIAKRFFGV